MALIYWFQRRRRSVKTDQTACQGRFCPCYAGASVGAVSQGFKPRGSYMASLVAKVFISDSCSRFLLLVLIEISSTK